MTSKAPILYLCLLLAFLPSLGAQKPDAILDLGRYRNIKVSPDGSHIAATYQSDKGYVRLYVRDLVRQKTAYAFPHDVTKGEWGERSLENFAWIDDEHIVGISSWDDGNKALVFAKASSLSGIEPMKVLDAQGVYRLIDAIPGSPEFIVAKLPPSGKTGNCAILRLSIENPKQSEALFECEGTGIEALTDRGHRLRLVKPLREKQTPEWLAHDSDTGQWSPIRLSPWSTVYGFDADPSRVLVAQGFETQAAGIYYFDIEKDKLLSALIADEAKPMHKIVRPVFSRKGGQLVGVHINDATLSSKWLDPILQNLQRNIDTACPNSNNRILDWDEARSRVVVERIYPDRPHQIFAFDFKNAKMDHLFDLGGDVSPKQTAPQESFEFENRDGVKLQGFLTLPRKSKKNIPLVIVVRNQPFSSLDHLQWHSDDQYYASLGYATMRLNFSGSSESKGDLEIDWTSPEGPLKPIHDIVDSIDWLAQNKGIDPRKIGIIGYGEGGWIATYATAAYPGRFACAASNDAMYATMGHLIDGETEPIHTAGFRLSAYPKTELSEDQIKKLAPFHNVSKMSTPLFLSYGTWSQPFIKEDTQRFAQIAADAGLEVNKPFEGAWWESHITNNAAFASYQKRLGAFLKKHLD
ncbi:CocE/NonD family hydrolase [Pelagicoccus sp. SDUM812003]|uniref:alpha/beta hydrolase family protein n=1 Tax=Pelagicoccus sp. SDUM812003 TaxID=3041267 RepID=UPI00280D5343|nr:CocE/NonD family hydrolase [Pelagicoccus sp. SDUM812003]MDQ8201420.1 prolyl oligopeptidase family serine peptidase [Pelagicoccus sp. SDUM812003]